MSEKEIQAKIKDGDLRKAFDAIVDVYSERLYWHVRRFTLSHEDADDLVQDIYIKIWNALPGFRGDSSLFTWIWRIATNTALNFLAKAKLRSALSLSSYTAEADRIIDSDPWFDGDDAQRRLSKAIAHLPAKQRTVFCLKYYDDLTYEEISEITGTSVGALKASYHIATEKIKEDL
ncbi:MAG: RNA polymerase sigma factor [Bacteroidales bacterium]|nr:RNA polymerase sigma factor [Bacteroidales bacterium]